MVKRGLKALIAQADRSMKTTGYDLARALCNHSLAVSRCIIRRQARTRTKVVIKDLPARMETENGLLDPKSDQGFASIRSNVSDPYSEFSTR